jgi:alpha-tubulin suppressor-like RCC1 family protein
LRRQRGIQRPVTRGVGALVAALVVAIVVILAATGTAAAASVVNAWGRNDEGQLGIGTTTGPNTCVVNKIQSACALIAQLVPELTEPTAISAGTQHTLAVLSSGTVMAWGGNSSGQLGNGTTTNSDVPVAVSGLSEVTAVSAGANHSLALLANGTVWAWGGNQSGQLGNGTTAPSTTPVEVMGLKEVTAISAGNAYSLALLANGTVVSWGANQVGQLGNGTNTGPSKCGGPTEAEQKQFLKEQEEKKITEQQRLEKEAADFYGCALTPVAVSGLSAVTQISAGFAHSLALLSNGTVKSWGFNENGQLGTGSNAGPNKCIVHGIEDQCAKTPVAVSGLTEATSVAAGETHSVASRKNGEAVAWGNNEEGQLGNGTFDESAKPVSVIGLTEVASVAAGGSTSMALRTGGNVMAWGLNSYGELGTGAVELTTKPVLVCGLSGVTAIAERGAHSLALAAAGPQCPSVTNVSPPKGAVTGGTSVTITGTNFTEVTGVKFGKTAAASFTVESPTTIVATTAPGSGTVDVTVTTAVGTSPRNPADGFTFQAAPSITSVVPDTGLFGGGTTVTINGTGFGEASAVEFGSTAATSFTVESPTKIKATSPGGTGIVDVHVTTPYGESKVVASDKFTYLKPPEAGRCLKVTVPGTGAYATGTCTTTGGEKKYEWYPAFGGLKPLVKRHFTLKAKELPEIKLAAATGEPISCKAETGGGELTGPSTYSGVTMTFTSCHRGTLGACTTEGATEGEIKTGALNGELGVLKTSTEGPVKNKIGLDLAPATGTTVAEFACGGEPVVWSGSVIAEVKSNAMLASFSFAYSGTKGLQKLAKFEGGPEDVPLVSFNGEAAKKAALTMTQVMTPEEKYEVNSVF